MPMITSITGLENFPSNNAVRRNRHGAVSSEFRLSWCDPGRQPMTMTGSNMFRHGPQVHGMPIKVAAGVGMSRILGEWVQATYSCNEGTMLLVKGKLRGRHGMMAIEVRSGASITRIKMNTLQLPISQYFTVMLDGPFAVVDMEHLISRGVYLNDVQKRLLAANTYNTSPTPLQMEILQQSTLAEQVTTVEEIVDSSGNHVPVVRRRRRRMISLD